MNTPAVIMVVLMALLIFGFLGAHSGMFPGEFLLYALMAACCLVALSALYTIFLLIREKIQGNKD